MASGQKSLNVSVPPQLQKFVDTRVKSGSYRSASEVVCEALQLLEEREREKQFSLAQVKAKIASGLAQARRGELLDGDLVFDEIERQLDQMIRSERGSTRSKAGKTKRRR
jgi:antitoxin ParD1/3/4